MNCRPSILAELNPRMQRRLLYPHRTDGTQLGGLLRGEGLCHHLSLWDAPTQLWQPQSHYNVQFLIYTSSSPAGGTGSRIRRFGQHARQTLKPPIQI